MSEDERDRRQDQYYRYWCRLNLVAQQCWRLGVGDEDCCPMDPNVPAGDPDEMVSELRRVADEMEGRK